MSYQVADSGGNDNLHEVDSYDNGCSSVCGKTSSGLESSDKENLSENSEHDDLSSDAKSCEEVNSCSYL